MVILFDIFQYLAIYGTPQESNGVKKDQIFPVFPQGIVDNWNFVFFVQISWWWHPILIYFNIWPIWDTPWIKNKGGIKNGWK